MEKYCNKDRKIQVDKKPRKLVQTKKKNAQASSKVMYGHEQICEVRKEINFWEAEGQFQEWVARGSGKQDQPEVVI